MIHTVLIVGHAAAGVAALILGCAVLRPDDAVRSTAFRLYLASLIALVVLLIAVVVYDWPDLEGAQRVTFSLLAGLGLYTLWRGIRAGQARRLRPVGWRMAHVSHVGFTVISLFDGFTIVAAIDLGAPTIVVILVAVGGVLAGITAIGRVSRTEADRERSTTRRERSAARR